MNETKFMKIKNEYQSFIKKLNAQKNIFSFDCYLVDEKWINKVEQSFNKYNNIKKNLNFYRYYEEIINFPPKVDFINSFSTLIDHLKNEGNFSILRKEIMEMIYKKEYLNNFKYAIYYGNNNKSIIKFSNEKFALLLFNNFKDGIHFKKEKFIIFVGNKNEVNLYVNILSSDFDYIKNEINKKNSNIITFDKYIEISKYSINDIKNINQKYDFKNEIKKLFILVFYYERFLSNNLEKSFINKNEQYFLINHEYLFNLKKFFNYEECFEQKLNDLEIGINYINLDKYMDILSKNDFIENDNKMEKSNFDYFKNNNKMKSPICQKFEFNYFSNAFILPSKIY